MGSSKTTSEHFLWFFRFTAWSLICVFFLPIPATVTVAARDGPDNTRVRRRLNLNDPDNTHVRRRLNLNSLERQTVIADTAPPAAGDGKVAGEVIPLVIAGNEATRQPHVSLSSGAAEHDANAWSATPLERPPPHNDGKSAAYRPQSLQFVVEAASEVASEAAPPVIAGNEATRQSRISPSTGAAEHDENARIVTSPKRPPPHNDGKSAAYRPLAPQSVTEVLFNYAMSFAGVPGLASHSNLASRPGLNRGVDGSLDEGLGFHQDGTARKAGGVAGSSGPSANGYRARAYMQSGLQNGYGLSGYASGLPGVYDELHYDLWGRDDSMRGGRVSGSGAYSRDMSDFDPMSMALDRGLNYGAGLFNSAGEAALSGLVDGGRARLNFRMDKDGDFNGEGDALLPFYDSARTTIYTQLGARKMRDSDDTRWIGNFGLGQRWFPFAQGDYDGSSHAARDGDGLAGERKTNRRGSRPPSVSERDSESSAGRGGERHPYDAGKLMLGYNAFFDYDLTRSHQRGGIGVEAWYDWLRLSSNYYFPLSDWKDSEDFGSRFVKERPAKGWDARVKAYFPFYRHVAITGAYSQWYGDHVGMFGADRLEKDPKVWSYGVEYTPVPLVSGFITQKSTDRGRTDTEFGLNFTYHFQMPWEDQISPAKVAELRTVSGSRHEFVDREHRIILEYKAKNAYHIEYLGFINGQHQFRLRDGFNKTASGRTATITSLGGAYLLGGVSSLSASTNGNGIFGITLAGNAPDTTVVTVQAGNNVQTFELAVGSGGFAVSLSASPANPSVSDFSVLTATVTRNGQPVSDANVVFTWVVKGSSQLAQAGTNGPADGNGEATYRFLGTDDRRTVTVTATSNSVSAAVDVRFGDELPPGFIAYTAPYMGLDAARLYCANQGGKLPLIDNSTSWNISLDPPPPVDGFGVIYGPWPDGLPTDRYYWSGTQVSDSRDPEREWWLIGKNNDRVTTVPSPLNNNAYVVCVP